MTNKQALDALEFIQMQSYLPESKQKSIDDEVEVIRSFITKKQVKNGNANEALNWFKKLIENYPATLPDYYPHNLTIETALTQPNQALVEALKQAIALAKETRKHPSVSVGETADVWIRKCVRREVWSFVVVILHLRKWDIFTKP